MKRRYFRRDSAALQSRRSDVFARRISFEHLEDRRLLATVTVGNLNDVVNGTTSSIAALIAAPGGDGISLREAILAANSDAAADVIDFAPAVRGTLQLTNVAHAGEIAISTNLAINGPGAGSLTIRAFNPTSNPGDGSRIFNLSLFFGSPTVTISGLTLTGGDVAGDGGAILNRAKLSIVDCTISGNRASNRGGGGANFGGNLTVTASTITGNSSLSDGGGVYSELGSLTIVAAEVSGNAASNGGGIHCFASQTTIDSCTISGNSATAAGGVWADNAALVMANSTVSGNTARASGGGVAIGSGAATLRHSTITFNTCNSDGIGNELGGGIWEGSGVLATLDHVIVSGNQRDIVAYDDVAGAVAARFTLIGDGSGAAITNNGGNMVGTSIDPIDAQLSPLAFNGGSTKTHALEAGSSAIDAGDPAAVAGAGSVPSFDQRGAPSARIRAGRIDVGAYERSIVAVDRLGDEVDGNLSLGQATIREAIERADQITFAPSLTSGGPAVILLTHGELTVGRSLEIVGPGAKLLTIDASGNDPTPTTNNGDGSRVLNVDDGDPSAWPTVAITGLTLMGGDVSGDGGAIRNREILTLRATTIHDNFARVRGGAIYSEIGKLDVIDSTIFANQAERGGGIASKSIAAEVNTPLTTSIVGCTISGNTATTAGGGFLNEIGLATIQHSTITENALLINGARGSGIWSEVNFGFFDVATIVRSSIIAGNSGGDGLDVSSSSSIFMSAPSVLSSGYNLIGLDDTGEFDRPGDGVGISDPRLGPLADNGGPTMTHAPLVGSPAVDAGDPAAVAGVGNVPLFDQRGEPFGRVRDADEAGGVRIDIGAVEVTFTPSADFNFDAFIDGADFLIWQRGLGATGLAATRPNGNADFDADVDAADLGVWRTQFGAAAAADLAATTIESASSAGIFDSWNAQAVASSLAHSPDLQQASPRCLPIVCDAPGKDRFFTRVGSRKAFRLSRTR